MSDVTTVLDEGGDVVSTVAKQHPVPGVEAARTRPDVSDPVVVATAAGRLGVCVCFDADHPGVRGRLGGVGVVAVPASDRPVIGTLHADMARLRARSVGAALVRPARDGVSRVVGADGQIVASVDHRRSRRPDLTASLPAVPPRA